MQDDNDVLYCGLANQPFHAYSSSHLSELLSFHTDFYETVQARLVIFGMQVDNIVHVLYHGIVKQPSHSFSPPVFVRFFLSIL